MAHHEERFATNVAERFFICLIEIMKNVILGAAKRIWQR